MKINKLNGENNSLKAKIIDMEQIIFKYKEANNEYNNYINACYIFFNNITKNGLNQIEFDISKYNNKLMNLMEFKNKLNIIENYIVILQKEFQNLKENNNTISDIYKENKESLINKNNGNFNNKFHNENIEVDDINHNSDYYNENDNDNIFTKKCSSNNPNCSNIANCGEDIFNNYEDNNENGLNNNAYNDEEEKLNQNNNHLLDKDLNMENDNNSNIHNNNYNFNHNYNNNQMNKQYEIYKILEERVNMLEKKLNIQKQNDFIQSNN